MKLILILLTLCSTSFGASFATKEYHEIHAKGLKRTSQSLLFLSAIRKMEALRDVTIPGKIDLSSKVSPPENQGSCGSCWDFSLTKALRSALMLADKDPGVLAFNYLLDNCGPGPAQGGCGGGDFDAGQSFLSGSGPWLESQDPYQGYETRCKTGLKPAGTAISMVSVGNTKPSFQLLASALSQNHMLSVDVAVCGSWGNYSGGIFNENSCGPSSIDHMINIVGYNCETSLDASGNCAFNANGQPSKGDGYLIAMNNWGTSWGENGYMRSRWGMDALATDAVYFEVAAPIPPPPPSPVPPTPSNFTLPWWAWMLIGGGVVLGLGLFIEFGIIKKT